MRIPIFDSHIHMDTRSANDYEAMALSGVEAVLVPCTFTGQRKNSREAILSYFDRLIAFERKRAKAFGIELYVAISVHPSDVQDVKAGFDALEGFPAVLENPAVRAIGEITIRSRSPEEVELFERQLLLSKQCGVPVIVEAPPGNDVQGLEDLSKALVAGIEKHAIDPTDIMMVDLNFEKLARVWDLELGAYGIPVSPPLNGLFVIHQKVAPAEARDILNNFASEKLIFNSALHFGYGDPSAIARTLLHLEQMNVPRQVLERVAYHNPRAFFRTNRPMLRAQD